MEEELRLKYGRDLIPRDEVQKKLTELTAQGYICAEDVKYVIPMTVDDFMYYVNELRRNFLYSDYEFKDFDSFREPFHTFIDDLREKTQLILSEKDRPRKKGVVADTHDLSERRAEILAQVLRCYLQYERRGPPGPSLLSWGCLVPAAVAAVLLFLSYTPKPF